MRIALLSLFAAYASTATASQPPTVTFPNNATITGTLTTNAAGHGVRLFRGIPYAEPPIGERRWKQATLKPVTGDINATAFGNVCINNPAPGVVPPPQSEDCLFLNVYSPEGATRDSNLPVVVWVHGGQFIRGWSFQHEGTNMIGAADQKIVYVSIGYRLGVFGFLQNEEILAQGDGANFGLRDQEVAFQWVKQHIREFGGNPNDIIAHAQSSGAMSVSLHMISRDGNQQLFNRSIIESGGYTTAHNTPSKSAQRNITNQLAEAVGCSTPETDLLSCLRAVSADAIFKAVGTYLWRSTVDYVYIKDVPISLVMAGKISRIPTLIGTNTDEAWIYTSGAAQASQFDTYVRSTFPLLTDEEFARVQEMYDPADFKTPRHRVSQVQTDATFVCTSELLSAKLAEDPSSPTYRYRFNEPNSDGVAPHQAELLYVFNEAALPKTTAAQTLMKKIQNYWVNFINTANPNSDDSTQVQWPLYTVPAKNEILLQQEIGLETTGAQDPLHNSRCAFWYAVDKRIGAKVSQ